MASAVAQPLETQFAQIPGVSRDDLDQHPGGQTAITHSVRSQSQHRRRGVRTCWAAINAARGAVAEGPAQARRLYRKGEPGGLADFVAGGDTVHTAADSWSTTDVEIKAGAADQSDSGGRVRVLRRRPAKTGGSHSARPREAGGEGVSSGGCASPVVGGDVTDGPKGSDREGYAAGLHHLPPTISLPPSKPWNDVIVSYHKSVVSLRVRHIGQAVKRRRRTPRRPVGPTANAAYFW